MAHIHFSYTQDKAYRHLAHKTERSADGSSSLTTGPVPVSQFSAAISQDHHNASQLQDTQQRRHRLPRPRHTSRINETTNESSDAATVARQGFMASLALIEHQEMVDTIVNEHIQRSELVGIVNGDHLVILDMDITATYDAIDTVATEYWKGTVRDSPPHLPPDAREAIIDDLPDRSPTEVTNCMLLYMITYTEVNADELHCQFGRYFMCSLPCGPY